MTRNRIDAHRPSEMIPSNYRYLASSYGYEEQDDVNGGTRKVIEWDGTDEWTALGSPMQSTCEHAREGQCDHCGAWHTYQTILLYIPTGEILSVGHICAVERFGRPEWKNVIADGARRAELRAERNRKIAAAIAQMNEATTAAYEWACTDEANHIAQDIASKVAQYGPLTEKQAAFLVKLHAEAMEKREKIETGEVVLCPSGKVQITGEIKTAKWQQSDFGDQLKMLVADDRGFRVWGTAPQLVRDAAWKLMEEKAEGTTLDCMKGMRVSFVANVEPNPQDLTFGFFKRPTQPRVL